MGMGERLRQALSAWGDTHDLEARDLRAQHAAVGATPIGDAPDRETVVLRGTLRAVTLMPRGGLPSLEAELGDGTGTVTLIWMGRRRIGGIDPGRSLTVTGRISRQEHRRVLYNPRYQLVP